MAMLSAPFLIQAQDSSDNRYADKMPVFSKGKISDYIASHLVYPKSAEKKNIEGTALVRFVVDTKGKVTEVQVAKSSGNAELDAEAVRVVSALPAFTPGTQKGQPVEVIYEIPIRFSLRE